MATKKKEISPELKSQWYIITAVSGKEDSVVENLWSKIKAYQFDGSVQEIKIIKERIVEIEEFTEADAPARMRNTKNITWETITTNNKITYKKTKSEEKNKFLGYIFIKAIMDEKIWFLIRNTQLVTGIIGSSGKNTKPVPVSSFEIQKILSNDKNSKDDIISLSSEKGEIISDVERTDDAIILEKKEFKADFEVGSYVEVVSENNAMSGQKGKVISLNTSKGIAEVEIDILGSDRVIEIPFGDLTKTELE